MDFSLTTDARVTYNHPGLVVFQKCEQKILLVEVSCLSDANVSDKEQEKISKYLPLSQELSCCYQQPVNIIPVVFGYSHGIVLGNNII